MKSDFLHTAMGLGAVALLSLLQGCGSEGPRSETSSFSSVTKPLSDHGPLPIREVPIRLPVEPSFPVREINLDQLDEIAARLEPHPAVKMAGLLHLIRLDGSDAVQSVLPASEGLAEPRLSRSDVLSIVLNDDRYRDWIGAGPPFVFGTPNGARFSEVSWRPTWQVSRSREAHVGQTLSILGELGLPSHTPLDARDGRHDLADIVRDTAANFSMDIELYWVTSALALYLPPQRSWANKYGETFDFDGVAGRLMRERVGKSGPCGGTHALHTLTVLYQADAQVPVLSDAVRSEIAAYFRDAVGELEATQLPDGSWDDLWTTELATESAERAADGGTEFAPERDRKITITGHVLEWMALLPAGFRLDADRLVAASDFLIRRTLEVPVPLLRRETCRYSHGIRGIQLLASDRSGPRALAARAGAAPPNSFERTNQ